MPLVMLCCLPCPLHTCQFHVTTLQILDVGQMYNIVLFLWLCQTSVTFFTSSLQLVTPMTRAHTHTHTSSSTNHIPVLVRGRAKDKETYILVAPLLRDTSTGLCFVCGPTSIFLLWHPVVVLFSNRIVIVEHPVNIQIIAAEYSIEGYIRYTV